jgi:hypothetical protein
MVQWPGMGSTSLRVSILSKPIINLTSEYYSVFILTSNYIRIHVVLLTSFTFTSKGSFGAMILTEILQM